MKCTQHGICVQVAFKNARAMLLSKLGGAGNCFLSVSKNLQENSGNPGPVCICSPQKFIGDTSTSAQLIRYQHLDIVEFKELRGQHSLIPDTLNIEVHFYHMLCGHNKTWIT